MFAPKNIPVPIGFSEYSDALLKKAIDIAEQYKAKIYLLHEWMIHRKIRDYKACILSVSASQNRTTPPH